MMSDVLPIPQVGRRNGGRSTLQEVRGHHIFATYIRQSVRSRDSSSCDFFPRTNSRDRSGQWGRYLTPADEAVVRHQKVLT
jgi:hypothetical protein